MKTLVVKLHIMVYFIFYFYWLFIYENFKIVSDVVTESQEISTGTLLNDDFMQIKVETEFISSLPEQNKDIYDSCELSKYVDTPNEPMTGKLVIFIK